MLDVDLIVGIAAGLGFGLMVGWGAGGTAAVRSLLVGCDDPRHRTARKLMGRWWYVIPEDEWVKASAAVLREDLRRCEEESR